MLVRITKERWEAEGEKRFGKDKQEWQFQCPVCKTHTKVKEWLERGGHKMVAFSCIGRLTGATRQMGESGRGTCNYAGGGLFRLNPIIITDENGVDHDMFDFAVEPLEGQ